jgi:hypothetical protein
VADACAGRTWRELVSSGLEEEISYLPSDKTVYRRGQLVLFASAAALDSGATVQTYARGQTRNIVWAKMPALQAGRTVSMVTVVVPTDAGTKIKALANAISVVQENAGARVRLPLGSPLEVDLCDSAWSVHRSGDATRTMIR